MKCRLSAEDMYGLPTFTLLRRIIEEIFDHAIGM